MAGIFDGWARQGYSAVGHCKDILSLGIEGIPCDWAYPLNIIGIFIGGALQGYLMIGHCSDI